MVEQLDYQELNSLVKHFLQFNGLKQSVHAFDHEIRAKVLQNQAKAEEDAIRIRRGAGLNDGDAFLSVLQVNRAPQSEQDLA